MSKEMEKAKRFLWPGAVVPVDIPTTGELVRSLGEAVAEVERLQQECAKLDAQNLSLHRKLAASELNEKTALSRYENANRGKIRAEKDLVDRVEELGNMQIRLRMAVCILNSHNIQHSFHDV